MYKNDKELTLNSETFSNLKEDFDAILNKTIGNMEMKGAEEANVTLKLNIKLEKATNYIENREIDFTRPSFKHDISSVMQVKDKKSGQLNGEMCLVYDEESGTYILRPITNGQMQFGTDGSIYDGNGNIVVDSTVRDVTENSALIEGSNTPLLESSDVEDEPKEQTEEDDELVNEAYAPDGMSRYEWLSQFVGESMKVTEADGEYGVWLAKDERLVLSTHANPESPMYLNRENSVDMVGKNLICVRYEVDGRSISVSVECVENEFVVAEAYAPEE